MNMPLTGWAGDVLPMVFFRPTLGTLMSPLLVSTGVVALAEIGDKTQLLSLLLAARFRKPVPIILGIFLSTLLNHALAGLVGEWISRALGPETLRWAVGLSFLAIALWTLKPDKLEGDEAKKSHGSVFVITFVTFFLAEMGDKTQIATVLLAAKYHALLAVVMGTTIGMMLANVPVVLLGQAASAKIPFKAVRYVAAGLFALLGIVALLGVGAATQ
jgi:putative Ca2+/H+ antiporter (TMEM165/GDT1 family)